MSANKYFVVALIGMVPLIVYAVTYKNWIVCIPWGLYVIVSLALGLWKKKKERTNEAPLCRGAIAESPDQYPNNTQPSTPEQEE